MKFQFVAMVNIQVMGECEGIGDDLAIVSHPTVIITPSLIHYPTEVEEFVQDPTVREQVFASIVHHALQRAEVQRRPVAGTLSSEPIPVADPKDPSKRN